MHGRKTGLWPGPTAQGPGPRRGGYRGLAGPLGVLEGVGEVRGEPAGPGVVGHVPEEHAAEAPKRAGTQPPG